MVRVRLAALALATGLVFLSGCCCHWDFPIYNRLRGHMCGCGDTVSEGPIIEGPVLGSSDQVPIMTPPPPTAPPPRVVPIPQAAPMPYTP
jgi:hypothetical protein